MRSASPVRRSAALAALALVLALAACRTRWGVEEREAAVHVWLEVPAAAQATQNVEVQVTVGGRQAANGTYAFPAGRTRQEMPAVYLRTGPQPVVVTRGGQVVANESVPVGHVTWLVVTLEGAGAKISRSKFEPGTLR
jgi:hypothetical protein